MTKHPFNMIEVAIALGVAAIALVSLMALFPIGSRAGRDAMAETFAAEAADEMLHQLESVLRRNWDVGIVPDGRPGPENEPPYDPEDANYNVLVEIDDRPTLLEAQPSGTGIYKLVREVEIEDEIIREFEGIAAIGRSKVEIPGGIELPYSTAIRLNMEISWPARASYDDREKREYVYEIFNR